jgi:hypothetical protein
MNTGTADNAEKKLPVQSFSHPDGTPVPDAVQPYAVPAGYPLYIGTTYQVSERGWCILKAYRLLQTAYRCGNVL